MANEQVGSSPPEQPASPVSKLREDMEQQYNTLAESCKDFQEQLRQVKASVDRNNSEIAQRIEKIIALMTVHMNHIKEMMDIIDDYGSRIGEQERQNAQQELRNAAMIERQKQLASSLAKLSKTTREIVDEIDALKQREESHDKFQWRVTCICAVGVAIIMWLFTGDNFAKILYAIQSFGSK